MDYGEWTENSRGTYNKWDGIARSTVQVCFGGVFCHLCALPRCDLLPSTTLASNLLLCVDM